VSVRYVPADTDAEAARVQLAVLRRMSPARRLEQVFEMNAFVRSLALEGERRRHPGWTEEQVRLAILRLSLGDELFRKVGPTGRPSDMTQDEFLGAIADLLDAAGIPFMVAGSVGSSYHGHARTTADVDLVIDPTPEQLEHLLRLIGDRFYVSSEGAREALARRSLFHVIHFDEGWKADLIVRKERPFSAEEFARRKTVLLRGRAFPLASAEDVILTKLEWDRITPSERQVRDALEVAVVAWASLELAYLRRWAGPLGVAEKLEEVLRQAEAAQPGGESP
jgi:hypothetical protein